MKRRFLGILVEARRQLFEANGTLFLLQRDIEKGDPNPTRILGKIIKEPLTNLSIDVWNLILILKTATKTMELDESIDDSYSVPLVHSESGLGRKRYDITKEQLEHLRSLFFSWTKIAVVLQVSIATIQRRRKEFGLQDEFERFSIITDDELDEIYLSISGNSRESPITPNIGRRRFIQGLNYTAIQGSICGVSELIMR